MEFNYTIKLAQQFCSVAAPCRAAGSTAPDIAREYVAYYAAGQWPMRSIDEDMVRDFIAAAGSAGGPQAQAVVNAGWQVLKLRQQAEYPVPGVVRHDGQRLSDLRSRSAEWRLGL